MPRQLIILQCLVALLILNSVGASTAARDGCRTRLAVVGGGIGGASAAYYLRKTASEISALRNCEITIDLFEREQRLGGRIESFDYEGEAYELGADVWSAKVNSYIDALAHEVGVPIVGYGMPSDSRRAEPPPSSIADPIAFENTVVWEGQKGAFVPFTLPELGINTLRTAASMELFKYDLIKNYEFRDTGNRAFSTLGMFLTQGADMRRYMTKTILDDLYKSVKVDPEFTENNIVPIIRIIYEQNGETNSFAGLVSLISNDEIRQVGTGNQRLVEAVAKASGANIRMGSQVVKITANPTGHEGDSVPTYTLEWKDNDARREQGVYYAVFIAAPAEYLDLEAPLPGTWTPNRAYVHKAVTYVRASGLNTGFWGFDANAILTNTNSTKQGVPFYSIVARNVSLQNGDRVYKIFSPEPIPDAVINQYFAPGSSVVNSKTWRYTFTKLDAVRSVDQLPPVELTRNLFHISAIDTISVAMEGSVLSSLNTVRLWASRFGGHGNSVGCCASLADYYKALLQLGDADATTSKHHDDATYEPTLLERVISTVYAPYLRWYLGRANDASQQLPVLLAAFLVGAVYGLVLLYWGVASKSPLGQRRLQPWTIGTGVLALIVVFQYWLERSLLIQPSLGALIRARFFGLSEQTGQSSVGGVVLLGAELLAGLLVAIGLHMHRTFLPASALVLRPLFRKDLASLILTSGLVVFAGTIRDALYLLPLAGFLTRATTGCLRLASAGLSWLDFPIDGAASISIAVLVVTLALLRQTGAGVLLAVPAFILALVSFESAITGVGQSIISGFGVVGATVDPLGIAASHNSIESAVLLSLGMCVGGLLSWLAAGSSPIPPAIEDDFSDEGGDEDGGVTARLRTFAKRAVGATLIVVGLSVSQATVWTLVFTYGILAVLSALTCT